MNLHFQNYALRISISYCSLVNSILKSHNIEKQIDRTTAQVDKNPLKSKLDGRKSAFFVMITTFHRK